MWNPNRVLGSKPHILPTADLEQDSQGFAKKPAPVHGVYVKAAGCVAFPLTIPSILICSPAPVT